VLEPFVIDDGSIFDSNYAQRGPIKFCANHKIFSRVHNETQKV